MFSRKARSDGRSIEKRYRFRETRTSSTSQHQERPQRAAFGLVLTPVSEHGASGGQTAGHEHAVAFANAKLTEKTLDALKTARSSSSGLAGRGSCSVLCFAGDAPFGHRDCVARETI